MELNHFDPDGKAWMVDVGGKENTRREATAQGIIRMSRECYRIAAAGSTDAEVGGRILKGRSERE